MAEINITEEDLQAAENFLVQYLTEKVPDASFERGSAMRDFVINAFTYIFAYMKYEVDFSRMRQSLLRIQELTDADDISQAADEILSNWFLSRKGGQLARVTARLHFLERRTYNLDLATKFWRTSTLAFYIDALTGPFTITDDMLYPVYGTDGERIDYIVDVPLKSGRVGEGYNVDPGTFIRVDFPGGMPFFTYAEHLNRSSGGLNVEATDEIIDRAQTAITVRNLINNRSCDTVLQQEFPEILETLTIGMGEPEMVRDRRTEIASHISLHTGGHYDTYLELPMMTVEDAGVIGGYFQRPDNVINIFRDPLLTYGDGTPGSDTPFTDPTIDLKTGDVLYILDGMLGAPRAFTILSVTAHELEVSAAVPFTEASDETGNTVLYSAGAIGPAFDDKIPSRFAQASTNPTYTDVPVGTSRHIKSPGKIVLTGRPVQDIEWVEITDPPASMSQIIDPTSGTIVFPVRVNADPIGPMAEPSLNQYQANVRNPTYSQSAEMVTEINVGFGGPAPDPAYFDGYNLRVVYKTLSGFTNIHAFVENQDRRVLAANQLARARHPVWVEANIPYKMKPTMSSSVIDEEAAAQLISDYINAFDPNDDLDMNDLATQFRLAYTAVGNVAPFTLYYDFHAPDGQLVRFSTSSIVSIFITADNGVVLENSADIVVPQTLIDQGITAIDDADSLNAWYDLLGVSDRTIKYRSAETYISFVKQG
ncbi:MAG: hypothetical protein DRP83_00285 [Planctomycetota bacterium]|nr:MAG: hypothetical protein DRP83_00285 [Planctomycetota bacterium]